MNAKSIAIVVGLAAVSTQAFASGSQAVLPAVAVRDATTVVVICANERLPSQRSVGEVLNSNNAAYVYAERERLAHVAHRECMRGVLSVAFVRDVSTDVPALALAEAVPSR